MQIFRFFAICLLVCLSPFSTAYAVDLEPVDIEVDLATGAVDLSLGKRLVNLSGTSIEKGEVITIELVYTNKGTDTATQVVIEDYYNRERWLDILEKPVECVDDRSKLVCPLDNLEPGETGKLRYVARVSFTAASGNYSSLATISARQKDGNPLDNSGSISLQVRSVPSRRAVVIRTDESNKTVADFENIRRAEIKPTLTPTPIPKVADDEVLQPENVTITTKVQKDDESALTAEFYTNNSNPMLGEEVELVLTVANKSKQEQADLVATIAFPFNALDLLSTNQPYAYRDDEGVLVFTKPKLAQGGRWVIRLSARSIATEGMRYPHVAGISVQVAANDIPKISRAKSIVLSEADRAISDMTPEPEQKPLASTVVAHTGASVAWLIVLSLIGGLILRKRLTLQRS